MEYYSFRGQLIVLGIIIPVIISVSFDIPIQVAYIITGMLVVAYLVKRALTTENNRKV